MANPLNYNTDNEGDLIYDTNVKCNKVKINDSAITICSLNMHSLTVSSDSVKLKRVFEIDHDVMVLTDTSMSVDQIKQIKFFWRERVSQSVMTLTRGYLT